MVRGQKEQRAGGVPFLSGQFSVSEITTGFDLHDLDFSIHEGN